MGTLILSNLLPVIASVLGAALTGLVGVGIKYLTSKIKNEQVRHATEQAGAAVLVAVQSVEQTMRPQLVAALADGKLDDEEKATLREAALEAVRVQMGGTFQGLADSLGLSLDEARKYLLDRIEATVLAQKG